MEKHNIPIREACAKKGYPLWYLGVILGTSEASNSFNEERTSGK